MAHSRPSRKSSRVSSPAVRPPSVVASPVIKPQIVSAPSRLVQTSLDEWIEPPLQNATSYEEAGLDKSSLFSQMQVLGQEPDANKLRYKSKRMLDKRNLASPWAVQGSAAVDMIPSLAHSDVEAPTAELLDGDVSNDDIPSPPPVLQPSLEQITIDSHIPSPVGPVIDDSDATTTELEVQLDLRPEPEADAFLSEQPVNGDAHSSLIALGRSAKDQRTRDDAVFAAVGRAQEANKHVLAKAILLLYQDSREDTTLASIFEAIWAKKATYAQQQEWGQRLKNARALIRHQRHLSDAIVNSQIDSYLVTAAKRLSPQPSKTSAPATPHSPVPPLYINSSNNSDPVPPMGSFRTTSSKALAKAITVTPPVANSASDLHALASPIHMDELRPPATLQTASDESIGSGLLERGSHAMPEEAIVQSKEAALSAELPEPHGQITTQASHHNSARVSSSRREREVEQTGISNGPSSRQLRSRSNRISALSQNITPNQSPKSIPSPQPTASPNLTTSPKQIKDTTIHQVLPTTPRPARETRSSRRRDSSSDLSSVNEEIVNEGPPTAAAAAAVAKRSAAEAGLDTDFEETGRRRRRFDTELLGRQAEFENIVQSSDSRPQTTEPQKAKLSLKLSQARTTRSSAQKRPRDEDVILELPEDLLSTDINNIKLPRSSRSLGPPEGPPIKKQKTGARTKISPIKDRSTLAGISRSLDFHSPSFSHQGSPSRGIEDEEMSDDDNHDECGACGEAGQLVCCDGCENAFHFKCCDPPIKPGAVELDEPYFCHICQRKQRDPSEEPIGLLAPLHRTLRGTNTTSFQLTRHIQQYFAGVIAKPNGEYSDTTKQQIPYKPRNLGWDDTGAPRDKDRERLMYCHSCRESSLAGRPIIQCDFCPAQWHLDCLDPPMANPPPVNTLAKTRVAFRCPLHVENDLDLIGNAQLNTSLLRLHKSRKLRHPRVIQPLVQRGNRNNGHIEVDFDDFDTDTQQENGTIYKLSARSIVTDFVYKLKAEKSSRWLQHAIETNTTTVPTQSKTDGEFGYQVAARVQQGLDQHQKTISAAHSRFDQLTLKEQQTAMLLLNLGHQQGQVAPVGPAASGFEALLKSSDPVQDIRSYYDLATLHRLKNYLSEAIALSESATGGSNVAQQQTPPQSAATFDKEITSPSSSLADSTISLEVDEQGLSQIPVVGQDKEDAFTISPPVVQLSQSSTTSNEEEINLAVSCPSTNGSGWFADDLALENKATSAPGVVNGTNSSRVSSEVDITQHAFKKGSVQA